MNLESLHRQMTRMRAFEEALGDLWSRGLVSGEMHLGVGEEAIAAGVVAHLREGDAMALDYRPTPALVGRGVDLESMLLEMLGSDEGLCRGNGGHMHLLSRAHLATSTGIVGSPAPLAAGLALSGQHLRPGSVAVAFFGDGAANQGMVMEALNLAVVWRLPVVFVCKDNGWAVTTRSRRLTGGNLAGRARAFGMPAARVNGKDVRRVWKATGRAVTRARKGGGPTFLVMKCRRPRGHFEDDPLVRAVRHPRELMSLLPDLVRQSRRSDAGWLRRLGSLGHLGRTLGGVAVDQWIARWDPIPRAAHHLARQVAVAAGEAADAEVQGAVERAMARSRP
ncbi:MAG TPA: thiamine pyrophosphate-dependent dehydrogenase E1 component subunit alpha [Acidimicrobiia bacterium]